VQAEQSMRQARDLMRIYELLNDHFGDLNWWPGETPFEVIVGAILTQNTAWRNVEIAIANLQAAEVLNPEDLLRAEDNTLAGLIRPSGYYNIKTQRLKAFVRFLHEEFGGSLERMFAEETDILREQLLRVKGIGAETADSILLYAGTKPAFVVDAYTQRILRRHGLVREDADYGQVRALFMKQLPSNVPLYNQYHALLVNTGKYFCLKIPRCDNCPLRSLRRKNKKGKFKGESWGPAKE
jgi:endonuclease III related protein